MEVFMDQSSVPDSLPHPDRRKTARRKQDLLLVRRERELEAARRISQELSQHVQLDELVEKALSTALDVLDAENGSLMLADAETEQLVFHHSIGEKPVPKGTAIPWHEGIAGAVFKSVELTVIENAKQDKRHYPKIDEIIGYITRDMIVLPLKQWEGDPIGVIEVMNKRHGKLDGEDVALLTIISALTAAAIEHFRLFENAKLAEATNARLAAIVESSNDAIIGKTLDGLVTSWNKGAERIFGYSPEEMIGKPGSVLIPTDRPNEESEIIDRLKQGKRIEHYETGRRRKDGKEIDVSLTISPIRDNEGRIIGASKIARDITERKRAQQAMLESETRFRVMANTAPVLIWTSGPDASCTFVNKSWLSFRGRTLDQELGDGWAEGIHPEDRQRCLEIQRSAFDARKEFKMEYRLRRADGEYLWVLDNGLPRYEPDGTFAGYIRSCMDIEEDKRVADEIRQLNVELEQRVFERTAQLEASNKELESFSYSVSHDLRAPLRSIDGFSLSLLEDCADKLDARGKDYLRRVRDATQRMGRLIDDLLSLARVTRSEMRREPVELSVLARSIAADLKKTQPDRQVTFVIADEVVANGDVDLLRVALENLLGNAWKFTSKRPGTKIEFGFTKQNGKLIYFVRDDGAGFDMAYAGKLFEPFQRLHSAKEFEGTGIGLATVKRVIRRHGGRVWAESAVGQGATFYFTLQPSEGL
jgi:PAS domain S-box-containing protein